MGSMSSLRWTQSCQLLENPLSSGTLSNLSVGTTVSSVLSQGRCLAKRGLNNERSTAKRTFTFR